MTSKLGLLASPNTIPTTISCGGDKESPPSVAGNRPLSRSGHHNTRTRPSPHEQLKDGFQREGDAPVLDDKNLNNIQIPPSSPSV